MSNYTPELLKACEAALLHVEELHDAWRRDVIQERDGRGSERVNRNFEVEVKLRVAIRMAKKGDS